MNIVPVQAGLGLRRKEAMKQSESKSWLMAANLQICPGAWQGNWGNAHPSPVPRVTAKPLKRTAHNFDGGGFSDDACDTTFGMPVGDLEEAVEPVFRQGSAQGAVAS
jgi:hypothetical protein